MLRRHFYIQPAPFHGQQPRRCPPTPSFLCPVAWRAFLRQERKASWLLFPSCGLSFFFLFDFFVDLPLLFLSSLRNAAPSVASRLPLLLPVTFESFFPCLLAICAATTYVRNPSCPRCPSPPLLSFPLLLSPRPFPSIRVARLPFFSKGYCVCWLLLPPDLVFVGCGYLLAAILCHSLISCLLCASSLLHCSCRLYSVQPPLLLVVGLAVCSSLLLKYCVSPLSFSSFYLFDVFLQLTPSPTGLHM